MLLATSLGDSAADKGGRFFEAPDYGGTQFLGSGGGALNRVSLMPLMTLSDRQLLA